ncbi:hypothetical protein [Mycolicibacterium tusciae]|uniref:hypothetical protein n=1 Tax=Mycolicibacterium tusciae TaxID=75922 RepID=UPI00024A1F64|nr:hypothetical protein [Mycolicibacterium tusciae]
MNQTDWWQPYVPPLVGLVASVIVAAVAFIGVRMSNGTNEKAITAADERERDKWHRDNLLRICSEAVRVSREIAHYYNEAAGVSRKLLNPEDFDDAFDEHMRAAQAAVDKVAPLAYDLQLLGETELYMELQEVRQAGEFVEPAFVQYHRYLVANYDRIERGKGEDGLAEAEFYASLAYKRYCKATTHLSTTQLQFQFAAQRKISPHSLPERTPKTFEPVITPEKHPDLFYAPPHVSQNPYRRPSPFDWNAGDTADPRPEPEPDQEPEPKG